MNIKRYNSVGIMGFGDGTHEDANGTYVKYEDYATLKDKVEQLTEIIRREVDGGVDLREEAQRTVEENHKLRAEAERLRKAGDAMADQIYNEGKTQGICYASNIEAWKAAKEGKPSV